MTIAKVDIAHVQRLFDDIEARIEHQPVHVEHEGVELAVVLSPTRYRELLMRGRSGGTNPVVMELLDQSIKRHGAIYRALAEYERREREMG